MFDCAGSPLLLWRSLVVARGGYSPDAVPRAFAVASLIAERRL